jgi:hypothetical protein
LSEIERLNYITVVQCLQKLPPKGRSIFPVGSRFDDFVASRINITGDANTAGQSTFGARYACPDLAKPLTKHQDCNYTAQACIETASSFHGTGTSSVPSAHCFKRMLGFLANGFFLPLGGDLQRQKANRNEGK